MAREMDDDFCAVAASAKTILHEYRDITGRSVPYHFFRAKTSPLTAARNRVALLLIADHAIPVSRCTIGRHSRNDRFDAALERVGT
jgi:hypothetical protein